MTAARANDGPDTGAPALEVIGYGKRFGQFAALDDVSMKVPSGTFHVLLGENGAGKSTLVKCMMGFYEADQGEMLLNNRQVVVRHPREARALGLGMVYQHFTLVPNMTVLENFVLSRADTPAVIDWDAERETVAEFMKGTPFAAPLDVPVVELAAGQKQKAEILRQLYLRSRFLVLDEPTSVLTPQEADEVLGTVRHMTRMGLITALMITHRFREVETFADAVTVLRRGKLTGSGKVADLDRDAMAEMMVGRREVRRSVTREARTPGAAVLEVKNLVAPDEAGRPALRGVDIAVRSGEIVGVAGVSGNGQRQLVEVLGGQRRAEVGEVVVQGKPYGAVRAEMQALKVACLPEEPLKNACVGHMSVAENIALRRFDLAPYSKAGTWLDRGAMRAAARKLIADFGIRTRTADTPVADLSGGNVQRTVLARELSEPVSLLVVANPCFGLDFAAVAEIRTRIVEARNAGAAVLLISEDLDEVLELSDRILVMFDGALSLETDAANADIGAIGRAMAGT